jgi:outer membrane protein
MVLNSAKYISIAGLLTTIFAGCSNFDPDPECIGEISPKPGKQWEPAFNPWYCENKKIIPTYSGLKFPKIDEEADVGAIIDFALANHEVTQEAWANAKAAAYNYRAQQSTLFPTVDWIGSWIARDVSGPPANAGGLGTGGGATGATGTGGTTGSTQLGKTESIDSRFFISYLLLDFGGRSAAIEVTLHALEAANWSQNKQIQNVIINIMQKYYSYIYSRELLVARQDDLKNATVNMESAQALYESGVGTRIDFLQAKASVENAKLAEISAANDVDLFLGELAIGLGLPPETQLQVKNLPSQFPVDEVGVNLNELLEKMAANRPDLAAAYADFLRAKANLKVQMSDGMPYLSTEINVENTKFVYNSNAKTHFYDVAVKLTIPIFTGFLHKNRIKQATEQVKQAYFHYDNVESQASLEVLQAYYQFLTAKESILSTEEFLKFSEEAYEISLGSYKAGVGNILSLFTSQTALSNARAQKIQARTNWAVSLFNMAFATGTLDTNFLSEKLPPKNKRLENNE